MHYCLRKSLGPLTACGRLLTLRRYQGLGENEKHQAGVAKGAGFVAGREMLASCGQVFMLSKHASGRHNINSYKHYDFPAMRMLLSHK